MKRSIKRDIETFKKIKTRYLTESFPFDKADSLHSYNKCLFSSDRYGAKVDRPSNASACTSSLLILLDEQIDNNISGNNFHTSLLVTGNKITPNYSVNKFKSLFIL